MYLGARISQPVIAAAAQGGSLTLLQWLRAPPRNVPCDGACAAHAAKMGDLPLLQWLRSQGGPWDETLCMAAASQGNIDVLQWARSQPDPCP